ncbi:protein quick-to-court isoform X2 [Eupeodes corollae]|uniref:protein quick-to-court isoform X2 n=1 Tax=Eupeodes corollae TaxID=290404 RepID=UPI002490BCC2|nr:protein quick-to-court isoform X2 [Eupeodes corollae]
MMTSSPSPSPLPLLIGNKVNGNLLTDKTNPNPIGEHLRSLHHQKNAGEATTNLSTPLVVKTATSQLTPPLSPAKSQQNSKIPYPLSILAGEPKLFHRNGGGGGCSGGGSLRLRGTKSNLQIPSRSRGRGIMEHIATPIVEGCGRLYNGTALADGVNHTGITHTGFSFRRKVHSTRSPSPVTIIEPGSKSIAKASEKVDQNSCTSSSSSSTSSSLSLSGDVNVKKDEIVNNFKGKLNKNSGNMEQTTNGVGCSNGSDETGNGYSPSSVDPEEKTLDDITIAKKRDLNKMSLNLNGPSANANKCVSSSLSSTSKTGTPTSRTPKTPILSRTPLSTVPESKLTPKTPPVTPDSPSTYLDDDLDSLYSFATTTSGRSTMSCEHPYVARNGTTFSGRKMKYVVHCSNYAGQIGEDYLTPTQRAQRQIRRLKELLCSARHDLEQKDTEILRLTREVVELRLFKASLSSPEDRSNSSDAVTVREADLKTSQDVSPIVDMVDEGAAVKSSPRHIPHNQHGVQHHHICQSEMQSSYADSGHFEDLTTSSVHSKDSSSFAHHHTHDIACGSDEPSSYEEQRQELIKLYEERIEELIKTQDSSTSDLKRTHNDRVEALLQKLAECNTRYADIVPDYEHAKERIRELEKQLEDLQRKLVEQDDKQNKMYLHMYTQGQEAERIARADHALELAHRAPNKVSITELLHQLQSTQDELENIRTIYRRLLDAQKNKTHVDPEVTLQFLKSAVYYFLTDKENSQGHLKAIESILEFTEAEKQNITKARVSK